MRRHHFLLLFTSVCVHTGIAKPLCNGTVDAVVNALNKITIKVWEFTNLVTDITSTAQVEARIAESDIYLARKHGIATIESNTSLNQTISDDQSGVVLDILSDMQNSFEQELLVAKDELSDIIAINAQNDLYATFTLQENLLSLLWESWDNKNDVGYSYFKAIDDTLVGGIALMANYLPGANCSQSAKPVVSISKGFA